jgi:anti-anti-sigma factor
VLDKTPLSIGVETPEPEVVRLVLDGDLDYETVSELTGLTLPDGYRRLDADLSGVTFLDSSGLAALIRLHRRAEQDGAAMRVVALTPYLRDVLRMTAMDRLFALPPD